MKDTLFGRVFHFFHAFFNLSLNVGFSTIKFSNATT